jgi:twitching motility protein PilT
MSLLSNLMRRTLRLGGSDLHVQAKRRPRIRLQGHLVFAHEDGEPLSTKQVRELVAELLDVKALEELAAEGVIGRAYRDASGVQWRVQCYEQLGGPAVALRPLSRAIPTLEELHLPHQLERLTTLHSGLVLVSGPTGSGKTTTLAALLQEINRRYRKSIITLEDPIEYEIDNDHCLVAQRAVGRDVASFEKGLQDALSERPDVLAVGELRSLETIRLALTAAEMGLLVFATIHAADAAQSLRRVIEVFPPAEQGIQREKLAQTLQAVVCQSLLHAAEGRGRFPACELLLRTPAVAHLVREGRIHEVRNCIQTGAQQGMCLLDDALADLVSKGLVRLEEARLYATDPRRLPGGRQRTTRRRRRVAQAKQPERRHESRLAILALLNLGVFDEVGFRSELSTGRTTDLSLHGARVDLDHGVLLGTNVEATLALDDQVIEVTASVRSSEKLPNDRFAVGLHFEKVTPGAARALSEYLRIHG